MKQFFTAGVILFLFLVILASSLILSQNNSSKITDPYPVPDTLHQYIDRLIDDSVFASCFIGMKIVSVDDGTILYERNAQKLFHPASNTKLFTTTAAIHILDSGFRCRT